MSGPAAFDAPPLRRGLLLGSLQLCAWLFLRPAAFRAHLAAVAPELTPTFCLTQLTVAQLRNRALLRLLAQGFLVAPALASLPNVLFYGWYNRSLAEGVMDTLGVYEGALQISGLLGALFGAAGGIAGGLLSVWLNPLLTWLLASHQYGHLLAGQGGGVAGLCAGVGCFVAGFAIHATLTDEGRGRRLLPSLLVGLLVGALVIGLLVAVHKTLGGALLGIAGLSLSAGLVVRRRTGGRLRQGALLGAGIGVGLAVVTAFTEVVPPVLSGRLPSADVVRHGTQATLELLAMTMLLVPALVADFIGGPVAAAVAGSIAGGVGWIAVGVLSAGAPRWPTVPLGLACLLLGLTLPLWRPVLFYPIELALGAVLYRRDLDRRQGAGALRLHAVFWDQLQRLPLHGLEDHLVLARERDPAAGEEALRRVAASPQRWAAREAQIELSARALAHCEDVDAIASAPRSRDTGALDGPASTILRSLGNVSDDLAAALRQQSPYNQRVTLRIVEERLDGLLRELTTSSARYAARFSPIVERWRDLIGARRQALADEVERRREIDNPYVIALPLSEEQEVFIGRAEISARIERLLLEPQRPPLLLYGQRRMGKTSLLRNLGRLLPSDLCPLFVDLQGPATRSLNSAGFLYNLAKEMARQARRHRGLELDALTREALAADPFTVFEDWLDRLADRLGSRRAILLLDEFEQLEQAFQTERLQQVHVLGMLRHLIQHRPHFRVVLAGSHMLDEMKLWAGHLINVQTVPLGCLSASEARRLIEAPIPGFGLLYEPEATARAIALTGAHPYLLQLLCDRVVARKNAQPLAERRMARPEDVEAAAAEALDHGRFFFEDVDGNQIDGGGRRILRALAGRGSGASIDAGECRALLGVDPGPALDRLVLRDVLCAEDGGYRFRIELVRRWIASRRP